MDLTKSLTVIIVTIIVVIIINAAIFYSLRRRKHGHGQINLIQKAMVQTRKPWEKEDLALEELSERVAKLETISDRNDADD